MLSLLRLILFYGLMDIGISTDTPIVSTPSGQLVGQVLTSPNGFQIDAFCGIPFGEKTVRFQKSIMKQNWSGLLNVSQFGPRCNGPNQNEDCLQIKVLRPRGTLAKAKLPVVFWPHGGGFIGGDIQDYNSGVQSDNFVSKGMILVQPNYRTGSLGFWSTATASNPGNWGMWDILLALQWTNQQIASFGGDPDHIVLGGQGAGGTCSSMMTLSPKATGLYHSAFIFSGSMFNPLVNIDDSVNQKRYSDFATAVSCDYEDRRRWNGNQRDVIMACIRNKTVAQIRAAESHIGASTLYFHPRMDGIGNIWPYTLNRLAKLRKNIPFMTGTTHDETAWELMVRDNVFGDPSHPFYINTTSLNTAEQARQECQKRVTQASLANPQSIIKACQWFYVDSILQNNRSTAGSSRQKYFWIDQTVRIGSGMTQHAPVSLDAGFFQVNGNTQVYLYSFDYIRKTDHFWETVTSFHNMDLIFIENFFLNFFRISNFGPADNQIVEWYSELVTRFVKYDNPTYQLLEATVSWQPVGVPSGSQHLSLDVTPVMKPYFHMDDVFFWNKVVPMIQYLAQSSPSTSSAPLVLTTTTSSSVPVHSSTQKSGSCAVVFKQNTKFFGIFNLLVWIYLGLCSTVYRLV